MKLYQLMVGLGVDTTEYDKDIENAKKSLKKFGDWASEKAIELGKVVARQTWEFTKNAFKNGMDFDLQMGKVQALLGEEEGTLEHMNSLRQAALDYARESIFTGIQEGEALEYMAVAGWKYNELMAGIGPLTYAAAASGEDFAAVADIVTDELTMFNEEADQTGRFVDVMAATMANSNTNFRKLGQSLKYVGPIANTVGMSFEEAALFLGVMADNGIKASQAGTALRNILTRISTNAGSKNIMVEGTSIHINGAMEMLEQLGVSVLDQYGNIRDWLDIITDLRKAWNDMSGDVRADFADSWGNAFELSLPDYSNAEAAVRDLETTLEELSSEYEELSDKDIPDFYEKNAEIFASFGVDVKGLHGEYKDFETILTETREAVGGLSDEEKMLAANRVASLRALPAFIALLETSDDKFNQLWEAILGSEGAAEEMAKIRLDNLGGDVLMFNAALDTLSQAFYDDVKGPLRDIVQFATSSLWRIEDAIKQDGIEGGIKQLGVEIDSLADKLRPLLESLGQALVPIFTTLISNLVPALTSTIVDVGIAFGEGIFDGISQVLIERAPTIAKLLGLNEKPFVPEVDFSGASHLSGELAFFDIDGNELATEFVNSLDTTNVAMAYAAAVEAGLRQVDLGDGVLVTPDTALAIQNTLMQGLVGVGQDVATDIQSALDSTDFSIDVDATVSTRGWLDGLFKPEKHARAMSGGRILNHATIFGANGNGQPMIGGEAGQEAIIGTGSLSRIIKNAVNDAMMRRVPVAQPTPDVVLQMDGKTVARVQREHNASENTARVKAIALGYGR